MKVTYDEEADALYMTLREAEYYESDEIKEGLIIDYDREGNPIGMEIVGASAYLDQKDLSTVNFEISHKLAETSEK